MLVTGAGSSVTDKLTRQLRWACLAPGAPRLYALASALACFILHSCALLNQPQPESLRCEHYTSSVHHHGHQLSAKMVKVAALVLFFVAGAAAAPIVSQSPYAWACASSGTPGNKGCAESSCNAIQANIGGMVLVLSTGSMMRPAPGAEPQGHTPAECCSLCKATDLCNAWVFCNKKEGCGSPGSCTSYLSSLTPMSATNSLQGLVPAAGFGKYAPGCNSDGSWPYATCSLKQVAEVSNAPVWGTGSDAQGWIGGVTPRPVSTVKGCPDSLAELSCKACAVSKNPYLCHSCLQSSVPWQAGTAKCVRCANGGPC